MVFSSQEEIKVTNSKENGSQDQRQRGLGGSEQGSGGYVCWEEWKSVSDKCPKGRDGDLDKRSTSVSYPPRREPNGGFFPPCTTNRNEYTLTFSSSEKSLRVCYQQWAGGWGDKKSISFPYLLESLKSQSAEGHCWPGSLVQHPAWWLNAVWNIKRATWEMN